jgi:hypothetical protein
VYDYYIGSNNTQENKMFKTKNRRKTFTQRRQQKECFKIAGIIAAAIVIVPILCGWALLVGLELAKH